MFRKCAIIMSNISFLMAMIVSFGVQGHIKERACSF